MGTKFVTGLAKGEDSYAVGKEAAKKCLEKLSGNKIDLSIIFSSSKYNHQEVLRGVREITGDALLIGCSTAGEFTEEKVEKGSVACALISSDSHKFFTGIAEGLKEDEIECVRGAAANFPNSVEGYPYFSYILCEDGLSGKGEETAIAMLSVLGSNMKFAGGSAGDDLKMKKTYSFADSRALSNAVSLALIASKKPVVISVKHGHIPISPPLTVTKSMANVVYELNGENAFEVWKKYAREDAKNSLDLDVDKIGENSADLAKFLTRYEAGLYTGGKNYKIRWPGSTRTVDGSLEFATSIPEGTVLRVMSSPKENQIISARMSAEAVINSLRGDKLAGIVVFDCVVRDVILQEEFKKAVEGVREVVKVPMIGFETYGEFAMDIGQMSGYHNTTTVILAIPD